PELYTLSLHDALPIFFAGALHPPDILVHLAQVPHGLDDVPGARFALGADHRRALADAPQRFAQVAGATDERHLERVLVDVILVRSEEHTSELQSRENL